jgi:hypothetical protein
VTARPEFRERWSSSVTTPQALILTLLDQKPLSRRELYAEVRKGGYQRPASSARGLYLDGRIDACEIDAKAKNADDRFGFNITLAADALRSKPRQPGRSHDEWVE